MVRTTVVALLVWTLAAPSVAVLARQQPAAAVSRDWKRLTAPGLELVGNAPLGDLRRTLTRIVAFRSALGSLGSSLDLTPGVPTTVVLFRSYAAFSEFTPRDGRGRRQYGVGGYFLDTADRNFLVLPMFGGDREYTYQVAFHEYTHYIVNHNLQNIPSWLNEGLAEFYGTFEMDDDGSVMIGRPPEERLAVLRVERMPSVRRILEGDAARRLFEDPEETSLFYAQSWLLVHYMTLADQGSRQGQLLKFVDLKRAGRTVDAAVQEAFGLSLDGLDRELRRYSQRQRLPVMRFKTAAGDQVPTQAEPITQAEEAAIRGRLLLEMGAEREAERTLLEASKLGTVDATIATARLRLLQDRADEAVALLKGAADSSPDSFAAAFYLGTALYRAGRYKEAIAAFERALRRNRRSATTWFWLSLCAMALDEYAQSDSALAEAMAIEAQPSRHYARTVEALKLHQDQAAVQSANAYISAAGAGDEAVVYVALFATIAARRSGRSGDADAVLARVLPAVRAKSWEQTLVDYFRGTVKHQELLARARDDGQRTEARTYLGFAMLQEGRRDEARQHFTWVKDKGDRHYVEYDIAVAELKRISKPEGYNRPHDRPSTPADRLHADARRARGATW